MTDATPTLPERKACASCGKEYVNGEVTCSDDGTTLTAIHKDSISGVVGDKYLIVGALGGGGWGTVYKAEHILLKRFVAIKTLHSHMVASGTALKRFKQEALAGSKLDHPHILDVQDFGITPEGTPYIVMDFLNGKSLADTLQAGGYLEPQRAMKIFAQVASALAHAHRHGVVHRDLKPGNIMLIEHDGVPDYVKIVDFGIAKILRSDESDTSSQLTETGQLFGSPLYMSPEQCTGRDLDGRSDIYSLGCVMYRVITGQPPFLVRDLPDCIYKHVNETPQSFASLSLDKEIPAEVESIIFRALEKNPANRYQSMGELEEAIIVWLSGQSPASSSTANGVLVAGDGSLTDRYWHTPAPAGSTTQSLTKPVASGAKGAPPADVEVTTPESTFAAVGAETTQQESSLAQTSSGRTAQAEKSTASEERRLSSSWLMGLLVVSALVVLVPVGVMLSNTKSPRQAPSDSSAPKTTTATGASGSQGTAEPGSSNPDIAKGIELYSNGRYDQALRLFSSLAQSSSRSDGNLEALLWEGKTLNGLYCYSTAKSTLLDYMKRSEATGVNSARALNALAFACAGMGQTDEALGYLNRAERVTATLKGPDRLVYAATLRGLADVNLGQNNYAQAKTQLQEALSIVEEFRGPELEKALITSDLGETHQFLKEYAEARQCYQTALSIRTQYLSASSPGIANSLMCLGSLDFQENKLSDSEKNFMQALSIDRQNLGENNLEVALIEHCLGALYEKQKNYVRALDFYYKALTTRIGLLGANDPVVRSTRKEYTDLLRKVQRHR